LIEGLWDRQLEAMIRESATTPIAQRLIDAALERAGRDNITALVYAALAVPASESPSS
jgi:serine/threonine protein phosphatase PrpC